MLREPYFIIKKVDLKLKGESRTAVDGNVTFTIPIFNIGTDLKAKGIRSQQEVLELELLPPETTIVGGEKLIDFASVVQALKNAFTADIELRPAKIQYSQRWALQLNAEGKVNVAVARVGAEIANENSQEIIFYLCETRNLSDCIKK